MWKKVLLSMICVKIKNWGGAGAVGEEEIVHHLCNQHLNCNLLGFATSGQILLFYHRDYRRASRIQWPYAYGQ